MSVPKMQLDFAFRGQNGRFKPLFHLKRKYFLHFEARRAEAPAGACRERGAMRRPGGTDRNEVEGACPLTGGSGVAGGG